MAENISSIDNFSPASPIGIFDSGIGGLTVAKAVVEKLPQESIIYFGDTLHLPYGDKSKETITTYVLRIVDLLLLQKCKLILIACGSASAAAYEEVKKHVGSKALVLNVIDPMIDFLDKNYRNKRVGLIATKQTVESRVYNDKIKLLNGANIDFTSMATPLLVPIIEEGFAEHEIVDLVLKEYFSAPELQGKSYRTLLRP
jgi:glutamate racemase